MSDLTNTIDKLNIDNLKDPKTENKELSAPDLPRRLDGKIDVEKIALGKNEKGNYIVPDEILDNYYKELPPGVINKSGTWRTSNNGKIKILGGNPDKDKEIHKKGAAASNTMQAQRRTFKDAVEHMLKQKAKKDMIEELELTEDATNLDMIIASALRQAAKGNTKAYEFLRDTAGEKPTDKLSAEVTALTQEDKELLERVSKRLDEHS